MSNFNPKWLIGRRIVRVAMNPFETGRSEHPTTTDPTIHLDNGAQLRFVVTETDVGEYGVELVYSARGRQATK